jgi:hypothetical protein
MLVFLKFSANDSLGKNSMGFNHKNENNQRGKKNALRI